MVRDGRAVVHSVISRSDLLIMVMFMVMAIAMVLTKLIAILMFRASFFEYNDDLSQHQKSFVLKTSVNLISDTDDTFLIRAAV